MAPLRVLLVDDDRDDADLTRLALLDTGFALDIRVVSRRDALAAALEGFTPRLVLCDLNFPGWPYPEIRAALSTMAPDAGFVLLTGALPHDGNLPEADAVLLKGQLRQLPGVLQRLVPGLDGRPHAD